MVIKGIRIQKIILTGWLVLGSLAMLAQSPSFSFSADTVSLKTETADSKASIKIYKGNFIGDVLSEKNAILGSQFYARGKLHFVPLVPLQAHVDYTALYHGQTYQFTVRRANAVVPFEVIAIHPNTDSLPSNFLKFYLEFSRPINPAKIYDHIALLASDGKVVDRALLPLETPLLSPDGKILTLWIEPGRQKRKLGPNQHLGQVLLEGESYKLVVDKKLTDRDGTPLRKSFSKTYEIGNADRIRPDMKLWKLIPPKVGSKDALEILFNEPMDFGSLQNSLKIDAIDGKSVKGIFVFSETGVKFNPTITWKKNNYILKSKRSVEDISGNSLERLFDREINSVIENTTTELVFMVE